VTPAQNKQATDFLAVHVTQPCGRCGSTVWSVIGLRPSIVDTTAGQRTVSFVLVGCDTCFAITEHAAKPMGVTLSVSG
jgi:hypothetical protein